MTQTCSPVTSNQNISSPPRASLSTTVAGVERCNIRAVTASTASGTDRSNGSSAARALLTEGAAPALARTAGGGVPLADFDGRVHAQAGALRGAPEVSLKRTGRARRVGVQRLPGPDPGRVRADLLPSTSGPATGRSLNNLRRIETVINDPGALICKPRLQHLDELQAKARAVNARLLDTERVGQGCVLASPAFERVAQSTLTEDGRTWPALRFGDPRVMALLGALRVGLNALGFTNRSLRAQVSHLLGVAYTVNQASYDLARLRRNELIERRAGTNTYDLTADGQRVAIFYTKVHHRLMGRSSRPTCRQRHHHYEPR
jgi:hypothetical protein